MSTSFKLFFIWEAHSEGLGGDMENIWAAKIDKKVHQKTKGFSLISASGYVTRKVIAILFASQVRLAH